MWQYDNGFNSLRQSEADEWKSFVDIELAAYLRLTRAEIVRVADYLSPLRATPFISVPRSVIIC